jgi:hypothetical protein
VVVRGSDGLALGVVVCPATPRHAQLLPEHSLGEILRRANAADDETAARMCQRSQELFEDGRRLVQELNLPLELIDCEVQFDGQRALLHHLRWAEADERPLVSTLSRKYDLLVALNDLAPEEHGEEHGGCGKPGCGKESGGCKSCSTGGCATGCGSVAPKDLQEYFLGLRQQMEASRRTPLL